jgi:hypothetical protein
LRESRISQQNYGVENAADFCCVNQVRKYPPNELRVCLLLGLAGRWAPVRGERPPSLQDVQLLEHRNAYLEGERP